MQIGIITFHGSYNFGSVWQAFALQTTLRRLGYDSEIINYRMLSQKEKYSLFPLNGGWKSIIRNILQLRYIADKRKSNREYENFINTYLKLSEEVNTTSELMDFSDKYDIYLAGSDQIWGYDIPEFVFSKEDSRSPYFLNFTNKYKISYASSTGLSTLEELRKQKENLSHFAHISVREEHGKKLLEKIIGRPVELVLDPTYLIPHTSWIDIANRFNIYIPQEKYILIYTLQGMKKRNKWLELIKKIQAKNPTYCFITVSPFVPITGKGIYNWAGVGPKEILALFSKAFYVFTDTFHGLSFSIHFRKNFSLLETKQIDFRKKNILSKFLLEDRETNSIERSLELFEEPIPYEEKECLIANAISSSLSYLEKAIEDVEVSY